MPIVTPASPFVGNVLDLAGALAAYPDAGLVVYSRVSSWGQAGPGKIHLQEKTDGVVKAVQELAPEKLRRIVRAIEEGKLACPRPKLREAATDARQLNCILVAGDLSRFIRAATYSRTQNRNAWPTFAEFARLNTLTHGVPLATVEPPELSEDERHSRATRRTGKAGRPRIDEALAAKIFAEVEMIFFGDFGRVRWMPSLRELAKGFRVSAATILRLLDRPSPSGPTWREIFQQETIRCPSGHAIEPARCFKTISVASAIGNCFKTVVVCFAGVLPSISYHLLGF